MYHRESLTGLTSTRLWAAGMVMTVHYLAAWPVDHPILGPILGNGGMWVVFFFVLSGFILAWNYHQEFGPPEPGQPGWRQKDPGAYGRFLRRRLARLYPLYVLCLVVLTVAYMAEGFSLATLENPGPGKLLVSWFANLFALQVWVPDVVFHEYWNTPAWTVSVEMAYYLCFPYVLGRLPKGEKALPAAAVIFVVGAAFIFALSRLLYPDHGPDNLIMVIGLMRLPIANFWVFLFGAAVGLAWVHRSGCIARGEVAPANRAWATFWLLALFSVTLFWSFVVPYPPVGADFLLWTFTRYACFYVYVPLFGALIYLLAANRHYFAAFLAHPTVYLLGEASYAMYMWHWLILLFFRKYGLHSAHPVAALVVSVGGTVALAIVTYLYVEEPLRRRLTAGLALRAGGGGAVPSPRSAKGGEVVAPTS